MNVPWEHGFQPSYTMFRMVVEVMEDRQGWVYSTFRYMNAEDERIAHALRDAGQKQIAHALLINAITQEVYVQLLFQASTNREMFQHWSDLNPVEKDRFVNEVSKRVQTFFDRVVSERTPIMVSKIIESMSKSFKS